LRWRLILPLAALLAAAVYGVLYYQRTHTLPETARHLMPQQQARYLEIREDIRGNLHFSAHFTWAVNTRTIRDVRGSVSEDDIPTLIEMMRDERPAIAYGASALLATLGEAARPHLAAAAQLPDMSVVLKSEDALRVIDDCRDGTLVNPDVCPAPAEP
jgi:hypothetical protein